MKNLEKDWLTQGLIDFEYKKYILLSYLQGCNPTSMIRNYIPI